MNSKFYLLLVTVLLLLFTSCKKEEEVDQRAIDEEKIIEYLEDRGWDGIPTGSGLYYVVFEEGNGEFPVGTSEVTVTYVGKLENGGIFDESSSPITFSLEQVIAGWQEGIPKFSKGGSGALLVPSHLGYGENGAGSVPPNSIMAFEVDLIDFE